jgi:hypothetical protein
LSGGRTQGQDETGNPFEEQYAHRAQLSRNKSQILIPTR